MAHSRDDLEASSPPMMNIVSETGRFEGEVEFSGYTRFEGSLKGTLRGSPGSEIVLCENGVVEGKIIGETILINGFVRGEITASKKVLLSETGRVIGKISAPSVIIQFGAHFDGSCRMESALNLKES